MGNLAPPLTQSWLGMDRHSTSSRNEQRKRRPIAIGDIDEANQKGHSANSPTFSSAAAYTAAYTFSAASLHTPQRPPTPAPGLVSVAVPGVS
ncbi:hypothetical protein COJE103337_09825 [Corynebacterium jeikeium]|nr:hypothetical protein HMPREF0297_2184 [Corynebacterium jeikeium ATCC 43734]WCZ52992.1 hypothetical protein CJEIK_02290 [Corynebacterium jeikeium]SUY81701.1 Uncharacterised protein [Corynebacterium jeikeium]